MVGRHCYVTGCQTGSRREDEFCSKAGRKKVYKFRIPKDPGLQKKWWDALPIHKRPFKRTDIVCSLHFKEDEMLSYYETIMPDGFVHRIPRGRVQLKKYAVPNINLHGIITEPNADKPNWNDLLTCIDTTKPYCLRSAVKNSSSTSDFKENNTEKNIKNRIIESSSNNSILSVNGADSVIEDSFEAVFSFSFLCQNLENIKKPSSWWTFISLPHCLICAKWNGEFKTERRLVVEENLKARVYLKHQEILSKLDVHVSITSLGDLGNLLFEVDQFKMCAGLDNASSKESCLVYLGNTHSNLCLSCMSFNKPNFRTMSDAVKKKWKERNLKLKKIAKNYKRRIQRLENKTQKLSEKANSLHKSLASAEMTIKTQRRLIIEKEYENS